MLDSKSNNLPKWIGLAVATFIIPMLGLHSLLIGFLTNDKPNLLDQFLRICSAWYLWAAFFPFILWLARNFDFIRGKRIRNALALVLAGFLIAMVHLFIQTLLHDWMLPPGGNWKTVENIIRAPFAHALLSRFFIYLGILTVTISYQFNRRAREAELRASKLETELAQAEVETLKRKLEPERLFQNLKQLSVLMHRDLDEAESMIAEMGDDLRARLVPLPFQPEELNPNDEDDPEMQVESDFRAYANPVRTWLIITGIFTVLAVYFTIQRVVMYASIGQTMNWPRQLVDCSGWYLWGLLTPAVLKLSAMFPLQKDRWLKNTIIHSGFLILLWVVASLGMAVVHWASNLGDPGFLPTLLPMMARSPFWLDIVCYATIVAVDRALWYRHRFRVEKVRANHLSAELARAKLQALKMQLHPHFLFNSLNSLSELMREDPTAAEQMIHNLEKFLHLTVNDNEDQEIPFQQELEFLQCYLAIENIRYQDRLFVQMDVEPQSLNVPVPNLLLQPIVENAIRHGIAPRSSPGRIEIQARRQNGDLKVSVRDNGPGLRRSAAKSTVARAGLGLSNTRARLIHLYGEKHRFDLTEAPEGGLIVSVEIPISR